MNVNDDERNLFLAAEECPANEFSKNHWFAAHDERLIKALMAHGPVLIRGGRGAGKSALMIEASRRLQSSEYAFAFYVSLRYLPLLETTGKEYIKHFVELTSKEISKALPPVLNFNIQDSIEDLKVALIDLSLKTNKRIVLLFDDAAHIGREASLDEFFDMFRMISSAEISCKASIYPGVTRFGNRFDVYNDATVLDITKDERAENFNDFFFEVVKLRNENLAEQFSQYKNLTAIEVSGFLGRTVLGNMRAFILALNRLDVQGKYEGITSLRTLLMSLSSDYFWPLLEEVTPKLGMYEPLADVGVKIAEQLFAFAGEAKIPSIVIKREICQSIAKPLEILEYVGFIAKREASRSLRSGGRGPRYRLNLAMLLENSPTKMLSNELVESWLKDHLEVVDIGLTNNPINVVVPELDIGHSLSIFTVTVDKLLQSNAYPYGLTLDKVTRLQGANINTVGELVRVDNAALDAIPGIGDVWVKRIKNVVMQAVWM